MAQKPSLEAMLNLMSTFDNKRQKDIKLYLSDFENLINKKEIDEEN